MSPINDRWKFERWARRKPKRRPPPVGPAVEKSAFAGIGMFTAHGPTVEPALIHRLAGLVDWVAVKADGGDACTPEAANALRERGFRLFVWEAEASQGQAAVDRFGAEAYIGQAESQAQHDACLALGLGLRVPKALVSNVTYLPSHPQAWPSGWDAIPEAYMNANPQAKPDVMHWEAWRRGARFVSPCYGLYDASAEQPGVGRRMPLEEYVAQFRTPYWCGYLAETLTAADVEYLRTLR